MVSSAPALPLHMHLLNRVRRATLRWGFSAKLPSLFSLHKYTAANISYYRDWINNIATYNPLRLKFLDEAHFDSRYLKRRTGFALAGRRFRGVAAAMSGQSSFTFTMLTSLTSPHGFILSEPRQSTNTRWDFASFVLDRIIDGSLVANDLLIVDNAAIHCADDMLDLLEPVLDDHHIQLIFLPKYSPELNPCELVWAQLKGFIRNQHISGQSLLDTLAMAVALVSFDTVRRYYEKCIYI